jgi:hypothetical protein
MAAATASLFSSLCVQIASLRKSASAPSQRVTGVAIVPDQQAPVIRGRKPPSPPPYTDTSNPAGPAPREDRRSLWWPYNDPKGGPKAARPYAPIGRLRDPCPASPRTVSCEPYCARDRSLALRGGDFPRLRKPPASGCCPTLKLQFEFDAVTIR